MGALDKEKQTSAQMKVKLVKVTQDLSFHREQVLEKDLHLDGITNEVKNYSQHLEELVEELEQVKKSFFAIFRIVLYTPHVDFHQ